MNVGNLPLVVYGNQSVIDYFNIAENRRMDDRPFDKHRRLVTQLGLCVHLVSPARPLLIRNTSRHSRLNWPAGHTLIDCRIGCTLGAQDQYAAVGVQAQRF